MTGTPLDGIVVVDLSEGIAGGYCTKWLADGGAEVIKLEPPGGDPLRRRALGAVLADGVDGALFCFLAGNKRSVVVDRGATDDVALARSLLKAAVLVVWSDGQLGRSPGLGVDNLHHSPRPPATPRAWSRHRGWPG